MIQDVQELAASLRYAPAWADKLEALRQHSVETEASLLSTTSTGPLAEVRRVLAEAYAFADGLAEEIKTDAPIDYRITASKRQKVA